MSVVDLGLVIVTATAGGQAGLILLRGTSEQFRVEKLRELSAPRRTSTGYRPAGDFWSAVGHYVFVAEDGGIWMTNGDEVARIDGPTTIDHFSADEMDHVVSMSDYLIAAHTNRLLCMRKVGEKGAWTELATKHPGYQVESLTVAGQSVCFIQNGEVFRFNALGVRGKLPVGMTAPFEFSTGTIGMETGDGTGFSTAQVVRTGFTMSSPATGKVHSITTAAGPALDETANSYTVDFNSDIAVREEVIAASGVGFTNEASATLKVSGDVSVESVTFYVSPGAKDS